MIAAGIDCGARTTKAVIVKHGKVMGKAMLLTVPDQEEALAQVLAAALADAGIAGDGLDRIFSTGSGKSVVRTADAAVNEIRAMARGASFLFPGAGTVVDVGAEESRAARIGIRPGFAVTGGMAKNRGVMDRLMPMIGLERMKTHWDTQIAGAIGAALFGHALCREGKGRHR